MYKVMKRLVQIMSTILQEYLSPVAEVPGGTITKTNSKSQTPEPTCTGLHCTSHWQSHFGTLFPQMFLHPQPYMPSDLHWYSDRIRILGSVIMQSWTPIIHFFITDNELEPSDSTVRLHIGFFSAISLRPNDGVPSLKTWFTCDFVWIFKLVFMIHR